MSFSTVVVRILGWFLVAIAFEYGYSCSEGYFNQRIPKAKLCGIYWLFVFLVRFLLCEVIFFFQDLMLACCALTAYYYLNQHYDLLAQLQRLSGILFATIRKVQASINGE
jgi:hypothetical protein